MVVRSFVGGIIASVPLSSYVVPTVVTNFLKSDQKQDPVPEVIEVEEELHDTDSIVSTPKDKIHSKLIKNRIKDTSSISTLYEGDEDAVNLPTQFGNSLIESNDVRIKQYLNDQNKKFDNLINQNLDVVLNQQKYPSSPAQQKSEGLIKSFIGNSTTTILNRFAYSYYPEKSNYPSDEPIPADKLLDSDVKMDIFIDSLDTSIKIKLLEELKLDLSRRELINGADYEVKSPENQIFIDKVQDFLIISIKFMIVCLKLSIPFWRFIYLKFMDNSLFFFNERNLAKTFDFILRLMRIMDDHLHKNDDLINNYYAATSEDPDLELLYKELSSETQQFLSKQIFDNNPNSPNNWKLAAVRYVAQKYMRPTSDGESIDKSTDPKYSMYFEKSEYGSCVSSPASNPGSNPGSRQGSVEEFSFLKAAEQFADEL